MRNAVTPVLPTLSLCGAVIGVLILAEPVAKFAVDMLFAAFGY